MSELATVRASARLTETQMLRRRAAYSVRELVVHSGCVLLPVARPHFTKRWKNLVVSGCVKPPVSNAMGTILPTGTSKRLL